MDRNNILKRIFYNIKSYHRYMHESLTNQNNILIINMFYKLDCYYHYLLIFYFWFAIYFFPSDCLTLEPKMFYRPVPSSWQRKQNFCMNFESPDFIAPHCLTFGIQESYHQTGFLIHDTLSKHHLNCLKTIITGNDWSRSGHGFKSIGYSSVTFIKQ